MFPALLIIPSTAPKCLITSFGKDSTFSLSVISKVKALNLSSLHPAIFYVSNRAFRLKLPTILACFLTSNKDNSRPMPLLEPVTTMVLSDTCVSLIFNEF
jgi:hypothetical protein